MTPGYWAHGQHKTASSYMHIPCIVSLTWSYFTCCILGIGKNIICSELVYNKTQHLADHSKSIIRKSIKLMKGKALRKRSMHGKIAVSVLLKLLISGNE